MRKNDEATKDYIQELEADRDNLRFDLEASEEENKSLRLELALMWRDRTYVA